MDKMGEENWEMRKHAEKWEEFINMNYAKNTKNMYAKVKKIMKLEIYFAQKNT
jgi:hypothetical protein